MRDMIDERDYRERSSRSIVKSYNVHYMTTEELAEQERLKNQANEPQEEPVPAEVSEETAEHVIEETKQQ